ncbi:MAG: ROK family protein [Chloroflexi bacterium]|nr:ROK family protein [Chloroflexota bacterium]
MAELILGIEIGGTKLQLGLGTSEGTIIALHQGKVDVDAGGEGIRHWLLKEIPAFLNQFGSQAEKPVAIGCGFGGPLDRNRGSVLKSNQIIGWQDFPLRDWLQKTFEMPAWVENDSNAAAWGEYCLGSGKGTQYFFYTNLGSGVGGGFILNGSLYDGQGFGAGEFGHMYIPNPLNKSVWDPIKIENVCSGWSIEKRLRQPGYVPQSSLLYKFLDGKLSQVNTRQLAEAARQGDAFALGEIDLVAHALGIGLANVLCLSNVERIAIGGGVSNLGDLLINPVRKYTERYAFISSQGRYEVQRSVLDDEIVLIGAILLAGELIQRL